jgi:Mlc titration factor MtfA (ptsG expression regulator)
MAWTRSGRIREALERPFPDEWRTLLDHRVAHWRMLDGDERELLEEYIRIFLVDKRWEAANGFELSEEMQVSISAMACLLILGLDYDYYEKVKWIAVHPTTLVLTGPRSVGDTDIIDDSPYPILGQAAFDGPTIIAWDAAREQARHPERGYNVVYHEFAHKLDMLDGTVDGTPPLATDEERARWIEVCTDEYDRMRRGDGGGVLDDYATVNPGEFFAVATEAFFDRPVRMEEHKPELYEVLSNFYRQHPADRERRSRLHPR